MERKIVIFDDKIKHRDAVVASVEIVLKSGEVDSGIKYSIIPVETVEKGIEEINEGTVNLVICDLQFKDLEKGTQDDLAGFRMLVEAKKRDPATQIIVVTDYHTRDKGLEAMMLGAFDYLPRGVAYIMAGPWLRVKIPIALEFCEQKRRDLQRKGEELNEQ